MLNYINNGNVMYDLNRHNMTNSHRIRNNEAINTYIYSKTLEKTTKTSAFSLSEYVSLDLGSLWSMLRPETPS